jgi:hypothetical protein
MVLRTENVLGIDHLIKQLRGRKQKTKNYIQRTESQQDTHLVLRLLNQLTEIELEEGNW